MKTSMAYKLARTHYKVGGHEVTSKSIYVTKDLTAVQTTTAALKTISKRVFLQLNRQQKKDIIRRQCFIHSFFLFCSKLISPGVPVINPAGGGGLASFGLQ